MRKMTVIADDRCRVKLPKGSKPGDRFDVSIDSLGRIVYRRLELAQEEIKKVPLAKVTMGKDGLPIVVLPKGVKITTEDVVRAIREDRDSR